MVLYACKPSTHSVETGRPEVHGHLSYVVSLRLTWANLGFMRCYLRQQQQQTRQKTPSNPKQQITKMLNNSNTGTRENKRQCVHVSCFVFGMTSKSDYKQETQFRSQKCYPHRNFLNAQKKIYRRNCSRSVLCCPSPPYTHRGRRKQAETFSSLETRDHRRYHLLSISL